jgi:hypothetical protein
MDPEIWGPPAWEFIFAVIDQMPEFNAPPGYYEFFHSFVDVLPCPTCRAHYRKYWITHPIPINSRNLTRIWAQNLRNEIARRKPRKKILGIF